MMPLLSIWKEEFLLIFKDPATLVVMVVAVQFYSLFYPMPYGREVITKVPVAVVDLDRTPLSRELTRMIDATEEVSVTSMPRTRGEAQRLFMDRTVYGVVVIPQDFERKVWRQDQATVSLYADAGYFMLNRQVSGGVRTAAGTLSAGVEIKRLQAVGQSPAEAMTTRNPLQVVSTALGNPAGGYLAYIVPAVFTLILQQTLLIGIIMISGAPGRCKASMTGRDGVVSTVLAKSMAYLPLYLVHAIYYLFVAPSFYGFRHEGDALAVFLFVVPFFLSVIFLGLGLASLSPDREAPMLAVVFGSLPLLFLSGFSWPQEAFPSWLRAISWLMPTTAAIDGLLRINQLGAGLKYVANNWMMLWILVLLYFPVACWGELRIRRRSV
ncbi:MAG TPA: ABC transporter permease [Terriglobia bacterium]|nr:ABC transporter permease [Terriglobia bacterium]